MGYLSVYLPPFSSDYSGVCSALFDLNCLIVINDAACCTKNYVNYDEPRWAGRPRATLCTGLRTLDAIFGNDEKMVAQVIEAANQLKPDFIVVLGSPVPAIVGMDMKGVAVEIEAGSGYRTFGFNTTGFSYYNKGIEYASSALLELIPDDQGATVSNGVNILGVTPLDYSANENGKKIKMFLEANGFEVLCNFFYNFNLEQLARSSLAAVNLVVSQSGYFLAKQMKEKFGIPFVIASPIGFDLCSDIVEELKTTVKDKTCRNIAFEPLDYMETGSLLIVGDQIIANSLRAAFRLSGDRREIRVASFFKIEQEFAQSGDILIESEKHLQELLLSGKYSHLIGDPLLGEVPAIDKINFYPIPHPAISSKLYWDEVPIFPDINIKELSGMF